MGVSSVCLLSHAADWRWGTHADNSTWYPGTQLIRKKQDENWSISIEKAGELLAKLLQPA